MEYFHKNPCMDFLPVADCMVKTHAFDKRRRIN